MAKSNLANSGNSQLSCVLQQESERTGGVGHASREGISQSSPISGIRAVLPLVLAFFAWLAGIAALLLSTSQAIGMRQYVLQTDFRNFYTGAQMMLGGVRSEFYDLHTQYIWQNGFAPELTDLTRLLPFMNPPFVAVVLAPLAALPLDVAYLAWAGINAGLLAIVCTLLVGALRGAGPRWNFRTLTVTLTFLPLWVAVMQGQLSLVLVLALLLSWRALRTGSDEKAGVWLALLLIKPQFLMIPAFILAWHRRLRALAGLAFACLALLLGSLLAVGLEGALGYVRLLTSAMGWSAVYGVWPQGMHTWRGFLHLLLATDDAARVQVWWLLGVVLALGTLLWAWRGPWSASSSRFDLQWALLVLATLFTSPHAYFHDLSLLLVPGVLLVKHVTSDTTSGLRKWILVGLPLLGYVAATISLFTAQNLRLQSSVLFTLFALLVLSRMAVRSRWPSLTEST